MNLNLKLIAYTVISSKLIMNLDVMCTFIKRLEDIRENLHDLRLSRVLDTTPKTNP